MAVKSQRVIDHINFAFDKWLRVHKYYGEDQNTNHFSYPFQTVYPPNVPQQRGVLGDCGIWVCIFMERLIKKEPINQGSLGQDEDTIRTAQDMRRRLVKLFYDNILTEDGPVDSIDKVSNDDDVEQI